MLRDFAFLHDHNLFSHFIGDGLVHQKSFLSKNLAFIIS
jgi:hypothetical protein